MKHFTRIQLVLAGLGAVAGMVAWAAMSSPAVPVDPARARAWKKIAPRLRHAENPDDTERHLQRLKEFFGEKQGHTRDFAEDVTGWGGKWAFLKGKVTFDDKVHQAHMRAAFERHIFTDQDMKKLLEAVVTGYLSELEGEENALLVAIQADLDEEELPALRALAKEQRDEAFRKEFRKMLDKVVEAIGRDVKIGVGREVGVWVGSDLAAMVTVRIASAVAARLGISGGILATGAGSGVGTFGVGLVVGFIVDAIVDWLMRRAGYDPVGDISREVSGTLTRVEKLLIEGDPEVHGIYGQLRHLQEHDRFSFVRSQCRRSIEQLDAGGYLGLRHELTRLGQLRSQLREAALRKLILEGGS